MRADAVCYAHSDLWTQGTVGPAVSMERAGFPSKGLFRAKLARALPDMWALVFFVPTYHRDRDGSLMVWLVWFWWGLWDVNGRRDDGINLRLHATHAYPLLSLTVGTHGLSGPRGPSIAHFRIRRCVPSVGRGEGMSRFAILWLRMRSHTSRVTRSAFTKTISL